MRQCITTKELRLLLTKRTRRLLVSTMNSSCNLKKAQSSSVSTLLILVIYYIIQICPGNTRGRVLSGELYAQILQKWIYLHLPTDCFMKILSLAP